jgi:hypothetical protein
VKGTAPTGTATKAETAMSAAKRAAAATSLVVSRDNRQPLRGEER